MEKSRLQTVKILAISLFAKYFGLAVLKETELVYWGVKKLREPGMGNKQVLKRVERTLIKLIAEYAPHAMVIGKPSQRQSRQSPRLRLIYKKIRKLGKREVKTTLSFPLLKARRFICRGEKPTRTNAEKSIVSRYYPWLYRRYQKDLEKDLKRQWWKRKYHAIMFDAIALALFCYQKLRSGSCKNGFSGHEEINEIKQGV